MWGIGLIDCVIGSRQESVRDIERERNIARDKEKKKGKEKIRKIGLYNIHYVLWY